MFVLYQAVFRYLPESGEFIRFTDGNRELKMKMLNYPLVDMERNVLYVSDSHQAHCPGPGIWRIRLDSGETDLWCDDGFDFANGLALSPDGCTHLCGGKLGETYLPHSY